MAPAARAARASQDSSPCTAHNSYCCLGRGGRAIAILLQYRYSSTRVYRYRYTVYSSAHMQHTCNTSTYTCTLEYGIPASGSGIDPSICYDVPVLSIPVLEYVMSCIDTSIDIAGMNIEYCLNSCYCNTGTQAWWSILGHTRTYTHTGTWTRYWY